jgi:hypothetical protein
MRINAAEFFLLSKIAINLYLFLHPYRSFKLQKKPLALLREHPAWVIFVLLHTDTDPLTCLNPDPDPGSETLPESYHVLNYFYYKNE